MANNSQGAIINKIAKRNQNSKESWSDKNLKPKLRGELEQTPPEIKGHMANKPTDRQEYADDATRCLNKLKNHNLITRLQHYDQVTRCQKTNNTIGKVEMLTKKKITQHINILHGSYNNIKYGKDGKILFL